MKKVSQPRYKMVLDKDVEITLRDGVRLKADVFRPAGRGKFPAIINLGPYQKDKLWVPRGYCSVRVDTRGSGKSPGETDPFSQQEAVDFYDSIEWAAKQPWCNGNVGASGISYFAMTQWLVANLQPPSLKAMI